LRCFYQRRVCNPRMLPGWISRSATGDSSKAPPGPLR
jgi:hypothetical protein